MSIAHIIKCYANVLFLAVGMEGTDFSLLLEYRRAKHDIGLCHVTQFRPIAFARDVTIMYCAQKKTKTNCFFSDRLYY